MRITKKLIIKAKDIDSRVTGRTTGHPVRALRNDMTRQYLELEKEGAGFEELEKLTLGGLRKAVVDGDVKNRKCNGRSDCRYGKRKNVMQRNHEQKLVNETDEFERRTGSL